MKARGLFATCQDWLTFAGTARTNVKAKWQRRKQRQRQVGIGQSLIQLSGNVRSMDRKCTYQSRTASPALLVVGTPSLATRSAFNPGRW